MKRTYPPLFSAVLGLLLAACTIYVAPDGTTVSPGIDGQEYEIITSFEPDRGDGASYDIGDDISFRVRTTRDGYITLTSLNPDGSIDVFGRNIFVRGDRTNLIPGSDSRVAYEVGGPSGLNRVRAAFTPRETDTERVIYRGRSGEDIWTQTIESDIRSYDVRDVAQTSFYVR